MPRPVDILLPVRNAEHTLPDALDSVTRQTFTRFRVLVVDDGSTDGSSDILKAYADRDTRFHILSSGGAGLVAALNQGLAACNAPLIARMDADDIMLPERIERQVAYLDANPL